MFQTEQGRVSWFGFTKPNQNKAKATQHMTVTLDKSHLAQEH